MIREDLLDLQYYLNRLSKFMQESYGINDQVETYQSLLVQVNSYYDEFFNQLNFMKGYTPQGEILDYIGAIFGCRRNFTIPIYDYTQDPPVIDHYVNINLNDKDYITFIKTQVVKQNFDGRRDTLRKLYATYINGKLTTDHLLDLQFIYFRKYDDDSATCRIYWNIDNPSENLKNLFENGYLTIESMGIRYTRTIINVDNLAYYFNQLWEENPSPIPVGENSNYYTRIQYKPASSSQFVQFYSISASNTSSTWDNTKIYGTLSGEIYTIQKYKPINWSSIYSNYKILTITEISSYTSGCFYKDGIGGLYV